MLVTSANPPDVIEEVGRSKPKPAFAHWRSVRYSLRCNCPRVQVVEAYPLLAQLALEDFCGNEA